MNLSVAGRPDQVWTVTAFMNTVNPDMSLHLLQLVTGHLHVSPSQELVNYIQRPTFLSFVTSRFFGKTLGMKTE